MSYFQMDHAEWAARNIAIQKKIALGKRTRKPRPDISKGPLAAPDELSDFHKKVFDIIGIAGGGIYNAPIAWSGIQWKGWGRGIAIPWRGSLATFDGMALALLVMGCHEARIRLEIEPHAYRYLLLTFFPREHDGGTCRRHPNMEEASDMFQALLPADHRIRYKP